MSVSLKEGMMTNDGRHQKLAMMHQDFLCEIQINQIWGGRGEMAVEIHKMIFGSINTITCVYFTFDQNLQWILRGLQFCKCNL